VYTKILTAKRQFTEIAMKIAPALVTSFVALAALIEPASAAALSGQVSNYFAANTAISLVSLVAASSMLAANLLSRRRRPDLVRAVVVARAGRRTGA
jgi:hypothetical protein